MTTHKVTTLQATLLSTISWCIALGRKFMAVTPAATLTAHTAHFTAQALLIVTFILPIKILILLGAESVPEYLPPALIAAGKPSLIIGLSVLTVVVYALYLISEVIASRYSRNGVSELTSHCKTPELFKQQYPLAIQAFSKFTRGLSAATFALITFIALLYIYPSLLLITLAYIALATTLTIALYNRKQRIRSMVRRNQGTALNALSSIGFLAAFGFMVADFLCMTAPHLYTALLSLILIRQSLTRIKSMIQDIIYLNNHHQKISALFLAGTP